MINYIIYIICFSLYIIPLKVTHPYFLKDKEIQGLEIISQDEGKYNCGPSVGAILYTYYNKDNDIQNIQKQIGDWIDYKYNTYYDKYKTTRIMLTEALNYLSKDDSYITVTDNDYIFKEYRSLILLETSLWFDYPLVVLVDASILWNKPNKGLHWILIKGYKDNKIKYIDTAYGEEFEIDFNIFWNAWAVYSYRNRSNGFEFIKHK